MSSRGRFCRSFYLCVCVAGHCFGCVGAAFVAIGIAARPVERKAGGAQFGLLVVGTSRALKVELTTAIVTDVIERESATNLDA